MSQSTFSVQFVYFAWSEMLLASGDLSMYVVMDRSSVEECSASDHSEYTGTTGTNFFKQKTAYEIMSGDWSSDVCSSD
eukprot:COSAG06_NODE_14825_length_1123_cov_0.910156_2_plen_77_part_01